MPANLTTNHFKSSIHDEIPALLHGPLLLLFGLAIGFLSPLGYMLPGINPRKSKRGDIGRHGTPGLLANPQAGGSGSRLLSYPGC